MKISQGDTVIAANPFGKGSSSKPIRFGARIGLVSVDHPDYNGVENLSHGDKVPFIVAGAGEYEIGGITISGFQSEKPYGKDGLINTIYSIEMEGIRLCILGAVTSSDIKSEQIEGIGEVDILFVPVGGDLLSPADAEKVSVTLGAKMVIPLQPDGSGEKELKLFLKEAGAEGAKPVDKLTLKKKDLDGKEGEVVILEALSHA